MPMEGLAFHYDRHEEITRYIQMGDMHYHPSNGIACVLLTFKIFGWFCYSRCHTAQFNI